MVQNNMFRSKDSAGFVVVVDDSETDLLLFQGLMESQGYRVAKARDGAEAIRKIVENPPDVILLDVMMPGMDGFEVCRRLKADPRVAHIPVLLITALTGRNDRLIGVGAGANDFISKPIDPQEVQLRVRNAIQLKRLFDRLQEDNTRLKELESLRDNLTHMIVHDMRNPLTGIEGNLQLLKTEFSGKLNKIGMGMIDGALEASEILISMVNSLLDISRLEAGRMPLNLKKCDIGMLASQAVELMSSMVRTRRFSCHIPENHIMVFCDPELIYRVVANLIRNAVNFTGRNGKVEVTVQGNRAHAKVSVRDNGRGIPPEYHEKIFEKFGQVETKQKCSTGLGLTFCKLAVEAHSGTIGLDSKVGKGSTFWFTLPIRQKKS